MRIQHLGHSCLLVETAGRRILVDPGSFSPEAASVEDVDVVLVTHQHGDHVDAGILSDVLAASPHALVIAEPEAAETIADVVREAPGDRTVEPLAAGQRIGIEDLSIAAVGGRHAVIHPDVPRIGNVGFVVAADEEPTLGITGDSLEPLEEFRGIDVLALALVAPWSKVSETVDAVRELAPRLVLPVHDAVASPQGRAFYLGHVTRLAPDGTEVRDWPEDSVVEVTRG